MKNNVIIEYDGKPLFQRSLIEAPSTVIAKIEEFSCFFYVSSGNLEVIESNGSFHISSKEALLKKCGNYISRFSPDVNANEVEFIAIYFHPSIIQKIHENSSIKLLESKPKAFKPKKIVSKELMEKFINSLSIYLDNPDLIDEDLALLKFKELVMILLKTEDQATIQKFLSVLFNPNLLEFSTIIENNIYNELTIEELAFLTNKSLSSFKRFFKTTYRESPAKYIKRKRIEKATRLLSMTDKLVSDIAYQCGFQNPGTFSNSFHTLYGTSPSAYRKDQNGR